LPGRIKKGATSPPFTIANLEMLSIQEGAAKPSKRHTLPYIEWQNLEKFIQNPTFLIKAVLPEALPTIFSSPH
jgi:hypothetical protein